MNGAEKSDHHNLVGYSLKNSPVTVLLVDKKDILSEDADDGCVPLRNSQDRHIRVN
jgi:hypothetical protein